MLFAERLLKLRRCLTLELEELYKELILTHANHPHNFGSIDNPDASAHGANPLCGDIYDVDVKLQDGRIVEIKFRGAGCSISKASASMMTEIARGKTVEEIISLMDDFEELLHGKLESVDVKRLGELVALRGVSAFPARVKCAVLPWKTLREAVESLTGQDDNAVSPKEPEEK